MLRAEVTVVIFQKVGAHSGTDQPLTPNLGAPSFSEQYFALTHVLVFLACPRAFEKERTQEL